MTGASGYSSSELDARSASPSSMSPIFAAIVSMESNQVEYLHMTLH